MRYSLLLTFVFIYCIYCISPITKKGRTEPGDWINPIYKGKPQVGTLYVVGFEYVAYNASNEHLYIVDYLTGRLTPQFAFPAKGGSVYYQTALDIPDKKLLYSTSNSDFSATEIVSLDLVNLNYTILPFTLEGSAETIICSNFPSDSTIFLIGGGQNEYIYTLDTDTSTSTLIAPTPDDVDSSGSVFVIPSFNNRTNSLIFTGYTDELNIPNLYALNVATGNMQATKCNSIWQSSMAIFYDPVIDVYFSVGMSANASVCSLFAPGNIYLKTVNFNTCETENYFEIRLTRELYGWFQLFTFDPYTGYLFIFYQSYTHHTNQLLTVDTRNKQLVSVVSVYVDLAAPMQFVPNSMDPVSPNVNYLK